MKKSLEIKTKLSGKKEKFCCELLLARKNYSVLKYVIDKNISVSKVKLKPYDITIAYYWQKKPYVLYRWFSHDGSFKADYFNVADSIRITEGKVEWRDLELDVLFYPDGSHEILDADEIPEKIPDSLALYIENAKNTIIRDYKEIIYSAMVNSGDISFGLRET